MKLTYPIYHYLKARIVAVGLCVREELPQLRMQIYNAKKPPCNSRRATFSLLIKDNLFLKKHLFFLKELLFDTKRVILPLEEITKFFDNL